MGAVCMNKTYHRLGRFEAWDVLRLGTFYSWDILKLGCFRVGKFWGLGRFNAVDVFELGRSGVGMFWGLGHFVAGTFWGWEVLLVEPYVVDVL